MTVVALCMILAGLSLMYSREFAVRFGGLALFCGGGCLIINEYPAVAIALAIVIVGIAIGLLFFGKRWLPMLRPASYFGKKKRRKRRRPPVDGYPGVVNDGKTKPEAREKLEGRIQKPEARSRKPDVKVRAGEKPEAGSQKPE